MTKSAGMKLTPLHGGSEEVRELVASIPWLAGRAVISLQLRLLQSGAEIEVEVLEEEEEGIVTEVRPILLPTAECFYYLFFGNAAIPSIDTFLSITPSELVNLTVWYEVRSLAGLAKVLEHAGEPLKGATMEKQGRFDPQRPDASQRSSGLTDRHS
jgi:hypothetical protein